MKRHGLCFVVAMLAVPVQASLPEPKGVWEFDAPDPSAATIGMPLELVGSAEVVPGREAGDGAIQIGEGSYYICTHGIAPNGGGTKVNEWTLLIDFSYPASSRSDPPSGYNDLFQTNPTNVDDSDWTINSAGAIGIGAVGYTNAYGYTTDSDTWYRLVVVVDNGVRHDVYVDGVEIFQGNEQGVDGRFSLAETLLLFCAGNNQDGDDAPINVSTVAIWDVPLAAGEIWTAGSPGDPFFTQKRASSPSPASGADDVPITADLAWLPGAYAATHTVYFGPSQEDVTAGTPAALLAEGLARDASTLDVGHMDFGQEYYWRVDEVNAAPDRTVFAGPVWNFITEPFAYPIESVVAVSNGVTQSDAGPENTVNGSGLNTDDQHSTATADMWLAKAPDGQSLFIQYEFDRVYKLHEMLVWNYNVEFELVLGFGLKDVTVDYSENGIDWMTLGEAELAKATATAGYVANTTIDFGGVPARYVRLTVNSGHGTMGQYGLSEVRFTYIPVQAREPEPADGATGVTPAMTLNWRGGRDAASHEVYLGTDPNALPVAATVDQASYTPEDLEFGSTYYWQIVEVNDADAVAAWAGDIWTFSTREYEPIETFETYNDDIDAGTTIFDTWLDGWVNETGSTVGYFDAPFAERTIVRSGVQSMPIQYDNTDVPFYAEATREFETAQDWTGHGADTLVLYVRGNPPVLLEPADGSILMGSTGGDIWGTADAFRFAYKRLSGNGSIQARVDSLVNTSGWAKGGVMIRESLDAGSKHAMTVVTPGNGVALQHRPTANQASLSVNEAGLVAPYWVRITRTGDTLTAERSEDGTTWTSITDDAAASSLTIPMASDVYIGLALVSNNAGASPTAAEFSNISVTGNVTGQWQTEDIGGGQLTGNDPAPMYVRIEDASGKAATVAHPDDAITVRPTWQEWAIPYSDLAGVNLGRVESMTVGVGSATSPSAGGTGTVYIDDIGYGRPAAP